MLNIFADFVVKSNIVSKEQQRKCKRKKNSDESVDLVSLTAGENMKLHDSLFADMLLSRP